MIAKYLKLVIKRRNLNIFLIFLELAQEGVLKIQYLQELSHLITKLLPISQQFMHDRKSTILIDRTNDTILIFLPLLNIGEHTT